MAKAAAAAKDQDARRAKLAVDLVSAVADEEVRATPTGRMRSKVEVFKAVLCVVIDLLFLGDESDSDESDLPRPAKTPSSPGPSTGPSPGPLASPAPPRMPSLPPLLPKTNVYPAAVYEEIGEGEMVLEEIGRGEIAMRMKTAVDNVDGCHRRQPLPLPSSHHRPCEPRTRPTSVATRPDPTRYVAHKKLPSPASSDSEDDEPVTVLVSTVQDQPSVATRPDPTRYVAHKKMQSPTSSDSEGGNAVRREAVTAALETFLVGSSVGAEVEVGGNEFAEAAGVVDAIVERLADPPAPSAPSAPSTRGSSPQCKGAKEKKSKVACNKVVKSITTLEEETGGKAFFTLAQPNSTPFVYSGSSARQYWKGQSHVVEGFSNICFPGAGHAGKEDKGKLRRAVGDVFRDLYTKATGEKRLYIRNHEDFFQRGRCVLEPEEVRQEDRREVVEQREIEVEQVEGATQKPQPIFTVGQKVRWAFEEADGLKPYRGTITKVTRSNISVKFGKKEVLTERKTAIMKYVESGTFTFC
ncbi:hypothetical protein CAPTEDRAFT_205774 [Capitella teleta]|uniref:Uncharacterized protein n=1 Tax=Capitella teleta TaxID=283909 RepID=R7U4B1_CAPTE|nr:hypothetical protein CAPTEDRAFT_205774 [Capitella teleta]|eukprot:ELU01200.1 hypothetical protein CAPTEDRAFT_205774 [Capitella teleta]